MHRLHFISLILRNTFFFIITSSFLLALFLPIDLLILLSGQDEQVDENICTTVERGLVVEKLLRLLH